MTTVSLHKDPTLKNQNTNIKKSNTITSGKDNQSIELKSSPSAIMGDVTLTIRPEDIDYFDITIDEIQDLFSRKGEDELDSLSKYGGDRSIVQKLKVKYDKGLDELNREDLDRRRRVFGTNRVKHSKHTPFCNYIWEAIDDTFIKILIVLAIVQIAIGVSPISKHPSTDWVDGLSIIVAILIVIIVTSVTNFTKEKKFKEINDHSNKKAHIDVLRNGEYKEIIEENLLVGDIIKIKLGSIIPADGLVLNGYDIKTDESSLTGETDLVEKDTLKNCLERRKEFENEKDSRKPTGINKLPSPIVFAGTQFREGFAILILLAVGDQTQQGKLQAQILEKEEDKTNKTPLEEKLDYIAKDIGYFGIGAGVFTFIALSIRFVFVFLQYLQDNQEIDSRTSWFTNTIFDGPIVASDIFLKQRNSFISASILEIIILCIAIIVVAIPEGLPLAVTLSLAFSINKMMDDQNLVRKMHACEVMGGANIICSDKTRTLTQNVMFVHKIYDNKNNVEILSFTEKLAPGDALHVPQFFPNGKYYTNLLQCLVFNLDIEINDDNTIKKSPSKTDEAIFDFIIKLGENCNQLFKKYLPADSKNLKRFPFNSIRKKMSTIISHPDFILGHRVFLKGAAEIILASCKYYIDPKTANKKLISEEEKLVFERVINEYASSALRTICVAYKDIDDEECSKWKDIDKSGKRIIEEENFTLGGIVGIKDTKRVGVEIAVESCKKAGIQVIMVTGDNLETAIAIARDCKILKDELPMNCSVLGPDFYRKIEGLYCEECTLSKDLCKCDPKDRKLRIKNMEQFEKIAKTLKIMARSRPEDKHALVMGLKHLKNVVAVTGDGTNDAPALSEADVGFAMGIQGTEIAKNAADIIILDDNFSSIVRSVIWGRNIYENIRKFITFQLTVNLCAVVLVFTTACIGNDTPITPVQMLWINLIMDSLGSLALSAEPPYDELLDRQPYARDEYIINSKMMKHIILQAFMQLLLMLILYTLGPTFIPEHMPYRIEQAHIIESCYGNLPGKIYKKFLNYSLSIFPGVWPVEVIDLTNYTISGSYLAWDSKYSLLPNATITDCGIDYYNSYNLRDAYFIYMSKFGNTAHLTMIFNTFVFYTLFNQINCRVIDGGMNVYSRIFKNYLFIIIILFEVLLQVILVQFGGNAFKTCKDGLTKEQWGICLGFALISYLWDLVIRLLPMERCLDNIKENHKKAKIEAEERELKAKKEEEELAFEKEELEREKKERKENEKKKKNKGTEKDKDKNIDGEPPNPRIVVEESENQVLKLQDKPRKKSVV